MDVDAYTAKNIDSWDEAQAVHAEANSQLEQQVQNISFNNLNADFNGLIDGLSIANKSVVQVCCNNGIDLISLKNKGAGRCLGIDGAAAFVDWARKLAQLSGNGDMEFIQTNIYDLPAEYQGQFDVAMVTVGVINWMPDLAEFMQICASLLKPGGHLVMEEIHPVLGMYEEGEPSYIDASYFNVEPFCSAEGLDYFTNKKYKATENYWFQHPMDSLLMSAIAAGLQLKHIKELPYNVGNFCADLEHVENNPPLGINICWQLKAIK